MMTEKLVSKHCLVCLTTFQIHSFHTSFKEQERRKSNPIGEMCNWIAMDWLSLKKKENQK